MQETTPLIKAAFHLQSGVWFDVYILTHYVKQTKCVSLEIVFLTYTLYFTPSPFHIIEESYLQTFLHRLH